jgi:hypothetical protein
MAFLGKRFPVEIHGSLRQTGISAKVAAGGMAVDFTA